MKNLKKKSMLPIEESNDPDNILVKDKKFLTIAMLVVLIFMAILALTMFIVGIVEGSAAYVFISIFSTVISVMLTMIFVCIAHNISRQTVAILKIADKILGKSAIDDELLTTAKKAVTPLGTTTKENTSVKIVNTSPKLDNLPKSVSASMRVNEVEKQEKI